MGLGTRTTESYCCDCVRHRLSLYGVTYGLVLRESARLTGTRLFWTGCSLAGPCSNYLCRTGGLRGNEPVSRKGVRADDHFFHGRSGKHKLRYNQHTELGVSGSGEYCDYTGHIHVYSGKRVHEREPDGDNHLHADRNQCQWVGHIHRDRHRKHGSQTNRWFLYGQPDNDLFGFQQHAKLGDERGDQPFHRPGRIRAHSREWLCEREPNGDDHLHADGDQCRRFDNIYGKSDCNCIRRSTSDNDHFVSGRNTRLGVCRLHNSRERRLSALYLFRKRECQLLSVAGGDIS